ncbi:hypothetical protein, partial [Ottowia sp.]|uniref:hypothetical protein n=1 Tax=Ottowia sp. TaxID=1898956 RepID=UPI0026021B30
MSASDIHQHRVWAASESPISRSHPAWTRSLLWAALACVDTPGFAQTLTSTGTIAVPADAYFANVIVNGAGGGGGGWDGGNAGGAGGAGAQVQAVLPVNPGESLPVTVGTGGARGVVGTNAGGGSGGTGLAAGGAGGNAGPSGSSGGGGGGGGSSAVVSASGAAVQAGGGGGGGGGGAGWPGQPGQPGDSAGGAAPDVATCGTGVAGEVGQQNTFTSPPDGGGGGGGGGGVTAGAAGLYGVDSRIGTQHATGGGAGGSCVGGGAQLLSVSADGGAAGGATASTSSPGMNGSVTLTFVPALLLQSTWLAGAVPNDALSASAGGASVTSVAQAGGNTTQGTRVPLTDGTVLSFPAPSYTASGQYTGVDPLPRTGTGLILKPF